mmetsp:Transcript_9055/g.18876  ORF Transcript_9055/g.18876 Transcript_9055/m.18876 type:complete len:413 (-) Transcript_9055:3056-4294(-)
MERLPLPPHAAVRPPPRGVRPRVGQRGHSPGGWRSRGGVQGLGGRASHGTTTERERAPREADDDAEGRVVRRGKKGRVGRLFRRGHGAGRRTGPARRIGPATGAPRPVHDGRRRRRTRRRTRRRGRTRIRRVENAVGCADREFEREVEGVAAFFEVEGVDEAAYRFLRSFRGGGDEADRAVPLRLRDPLRPRPQILPPLHRLLGGRTLHRRRLLRHHPSHALPMPPPRLHLLRPHLRQRAIHPRTSNRRQEKSHDRTDAHHVEIVQVPFAGQVRGGIGADEGMSLRSRWVFHHQGSGEGYFDSGANVQESGHHRRGFQDGVRFGVDYQFDQGEKVESLHFHQKWQVVPQTQFLGRRRADLRRHEGHGSRERFGIRAERGVGAGGHGCLGVEFGGAHPIGDCDATTGAQVYWE